MKWIIGSIFLSIPLLSALGIHLLRKLNAPVSGISVPAGLAFFFAFLQAGYYPVQYFHLSFDLILAWTVAVLCYAGFCLANEWKEVRNELVQKKTLWVLFGMAAFLAVFYLCFIDLEYSDSPMYLNYIAQNIGIDRLNLFHLYTGVTGQEWDGLYLYQGYYHFVSAYVALLNLPARFGLGQGVETLKATVWGMGLLYSAVSGFLFVTIIQELKFKTRPVQITVTLFTLLYLNLYYWRVVFAFYGNTFRSFLITFLLFLIWKKEKGDLSAASSRLLLAAVSMAGLACSSSYLFISFAVLSVYAAYLFLNHRDGCLYDMSIIVFPLALYASVMISRGSMAGYGIGLFFLLYYLSARKPQIQTLLNTIERFLFRHARVIFLAVIPAACALFALYIHIARPDFLYGYAYYFNDHQNYDMVKDYFFVYSTWYDNLINLLRWIGLILFCVNASSSEQRYLKTALLLTMLVFMNPLCTPTVAYFIASNVFYRAWEAVFNPFTELVFLSAIFTALENRKWAQTAVCAVLLGVTAVSNGLALSGDRNAAYGFYIAGADENYNRIQKMDRYGEEAVLQLKQALEAEPVSGRQAVVLSQAEGTRVYLPQVVQLVTARDSYYADTRVNEELYRIAKRHHPWEDDGTPPYEKTCALLNQYNVDYIVDRYWENPEFDEAVNACSVDVFQNRYFRVKKVIRE